MTERHRRSSTNQRRGAALVEFAFILPVIFTVFLGLVEISRLLLLRHSADTAAYEGARSGMVPGATSSQAAEAAQELLLAAGLKTSKVTVTPDTITEGTSLITVRVDVPVAPNSWIPPSRFTNTTVSSEVTLFCERTPLVRLTGIPALKAKKAQTKPSKTAL